MYPPTLMYLFFPLSRWPKHNLKSHLILISVILHEMRLVWSYRPEILCTRSKNRLRIRFWRQKWCSSSKIHRKRRKTCLRKLFFAVDKSKVANLLKRVFPKFEADRSYVRGVNGHPKFQKKFPRCPQCGNLAYGYKLHIAIWKINLVSST